MKRRIAVALLCLVVLAPVAPAASLNLYSMEREIALGRQLAIEVRKQAHIVDDPLLAEYINRLGQNLARQSDVTFPVSFELIESDEINAFTLPGGFIYLNTGMLRLSDNEAELASVMSHELAHAAARHFTRQASRNDLIGLGTVPLAIFTGWGRLGTLAAPFASLHFSRGFENEADSMGVQFLARAGYDPNASVDMLERVEATERRQPNSVAKWFRSHPATPDRIAKTQQSIQKSLRPQAEYVLNTSEYESMRERLKAATSPRKPEAADDKPVLRRAN